MIKYKPINHQLFNVIIFITLGKYLFQINITWSEIVFSILLSIISEFLCQILFKEKKVLKQSSLISALAIAVTLRSSTFYIIPLVAALGIIQKYIFRKNDGTHLFNPSNFAIFLALVIFPNASKLDLSGWDYNSYLLIFIFVSGTLLLYKVGKIVNWLVFLFSFIFCKYFFWPSNPSGLMNAYLNPTILLLSFFIINDPQTSPKIKKYLHSRTLFFVISFSILQIIWGMKDIFIPTSLIFSNFIFRYLEQKQKKVKYYIFSLAVLLLVVFLSPYNLKRNYKMSQESPVKNTSFNKMNSYVHQNKPSEIIHKTAITFHKKQDNVFVTSVNNKNSANTIQKGIRFHSSTNTISSHNKKVSLEKIGEEYSAYASIGIIDINNDFYNDIILTSSTSELKLYVNNGNNTFHDQTIMFFDQIPSNIEEFKVIDFNSDMKEDIFVIYSQRNNVKNNGVFLFNHKLNKFQFKPLPDVGKNKFQAGSVAFNDINNDGIWDFYISFGLNWYDSSFHRQRFKNEFWVSQNEKWSNDIDHYFLNQFGDREFAGMSNVFSQTSKQEKWLFSGNDFQEDPSFIYKFDSKKRKFHALSPDFYSVQSSDSMSLIPIDFDNDSNYEIWESAIQNPSSAKHNVLKKINLRGISDTDYHKEMTSLIKSKANNFFKCSSYKNIIVKETCNKNILTEKAYIENDQSFCSKLKNKAWRTSCLKNSVAYNDIDFRKNSISKIDSDYVPKVRDGNTILKWSKNNNKLELIKDNQYQNTGWAWSSYPYDLNLDGLQDIYITSNFFDKYQGHNHLLINKSQKNKIILQDQTYEHKLNFGSEYRGLIIDDLDNNCTGEIIANNFIGKPLYIINNMKGDCIKISLRYKKENFWAINSQIRVHMSDGSIQSREILLGGIWGSSQSKDMVFGIPDNKKIDHVDIIWPNGKKTSYDNIDKNNQYLIFFDKFLAKEFEETL